ncbi:hypothetical protein [Caulobacter sp. UC70_42]
MIEKASPDSLLIWIPGLVMSDGASAQSLWMGSVNRAPREIAPI